MAGLNPKQQRFVEEYLVDLNATQAASRAGYKNPNKQGPRLLVNVGVEEAIAAGMAERTERTKIDADWVLKRLADEAEADIADLYEENGTLKSIHDWPQIWRTGLMTGIDTTAEYETVDGKKERVGSVTKLKLSDRIKRIEMIGKHVDVQAFSEKVEHTHKLADASDEELDARLAELEKKPS